MDTGLNLAALTATIALQALAITTAYYARTIRSTLVWAAITVSSALAAGNAVLVAYYYL